MERTLDDNQPIDGEILDDSQEPQDDRPIGERFWDTLVLPPRNFGAVLRHIREEISNQVDRRITQDEFGQLLGDVDQVTISRWERDEQKPQREQLLKIVMLCQQYKGLENITLARLQQALQRSNEEYMDLDARLRRIDQLLAREDENFKQEYYEVMIAVYHLLKGTRRSGL